MAKPVRIISLPGCKVSAMRSLLLTSTGVISLDPILGGGLPVGTITLLEEDEAGSYAKLMLKSFLSEGLACGHSLYVGTQKYPPQSIAKELMPPIETNIHENKFKPDDELKIAWRYQNTPQVESSIKSSSIFGHIYDLSQVIDETKLSKAQIKYFPENFNEDKFTYEELYLSIEEKIFESHHINNPKLRTVFRIGLLGLGTSLWSGDLVLFMYKLNNLIKSSYAVVFITMPTHCMVTNLVSRCEHMSDIVLRLNTLPSGGDDQYLNDYHGLFYIIKQCSLNSLGVYVPDSNDWGFKLKRRRFLIEKLHLPPELQESKQREQDDVPTISCGSGKPSALDF